MAAPAPQTPTVVPTPSGASRPDDSKTSATARPETALCNPWAHVRLWGVLVLGLVADLWSKEWAFRTLRQGGQRVLIPDVLELHTTLNPGALFGIGAGRTGVFLIASVLALVLVVWMFAQSPRRRWLTHVALGAILAGALGNMYDRAFVKLVPSPRPHGPGPPYCVETLSPDGRSVLLEEYPPGPGAPKRRVSLAEAERLGPPVGYVRDFIKIPTRWWGRFDLWPWVFNVADSLLVGGVIILAVRLLWERKASRPGEKAEAGRA